VDKIYKKINTRIKFITKSFFYLKNFCKLITELKKYKTIMDNECEYLEKCGFFIKYCETKDLACRGFINMYCKGTKMAECKRQEYRNKNGIPPLDDMMPSGQLIIPKK